MTKTMKRVLTFVLVGLLALSASVLGTFSVSKADAKSEAIAAFEQIVDGLPGTIENEYLANADNLEKLSTAKSEYLFLKGISAENDIDATLKAKWDGLQNKIGTVVNLYAEMKSLSVYVPELNANPAKISTSRSGDIGRLEVAYEGIVEQYSLAVRKAIDEKIDFDYSEDPTSAYVTGAIVEGKGECYTGFFKKLNDLIAEAGLNIQKAIEAIDKVWEEVKASEKPATEEFLGVDKLADLQAAETAINDVVVDDHIKITNKNGSGYTYENAKAIIDGHIADAQTLADAIYTLDSELKFKAPTDLPNYAVCYSRKEDINAKNDNKFTKIGETEDGYMTYFKTTHPEQYANLKAMLDHCADVEEAIADVNAKIAAIAEVEYVPTEWVEAIVTAETAFDALDADVKTADYINIQTLLDARDAYDSMVETINEVVDLIALIPADITLEDACWTAIDNARKGYDALSDNYKANFPEAELAKIEAAEENYAARKKTVEDWIAEVVAFYKDLGNPTDTNADKIAKIWGADLDKIAQLETAYGAFGADQQAYAAVAFAELGEIEKIASVTNIKIMQDMIDALENTDPDAIVAALEEAKGLYDDLHATQQELIDNKVLNEKWAKYQAVSYFDKAVAIIKANVDAELYFEQDVTLMNTLFVLYNVLDDEGRAMVQSYDDLVAIEAILQDVELINVYEYSNELAQKIEELTASVNGAKDNLQAQINDLSAALEKANSTATIAMVIAIIATVAAIVGIVLVFTKKN